MKTEGYIYLYTGNGKGKTTAALGLALRAAGAGLQVFIAQFVKGMHYSELESIRNVPQITIRQYGLDCFIVKEPTEKDILAARKGLDEITEIIRHNQAGLVILDEVCISLHYKLFGLEEIIGLLKSKPESMEIVMTGRYAPHELYEYADLITEMKKVKHYYTKGIEARKGIEF
ncbi:MAG TPA: cob(I)yrinic acid a,c-diamide adenosyltransferase [Lentimicrobium sp.]|jgi:cob(I)alamin adenosyltransferase|nr:cob(I)yrinic acid a,c-diamide adenosyltransferase [Lentimicrobium sp.]